MTWLAILVASRLLLRINKQPQRPTPSNSNFKAVSKQPAACLACREAWHAPSAVEHDALNAVLERGEGPDSSTGGRACAAGRRRAGRHPASSGATCQWPAVRAVGLHVESGTECSQMSVVRWRDWILVCWSQINKSFIHHKSMRSFNRLINSILFLSENDLPIDTERVHLA